MKEIVITVHYKNRNYQTNVIVDKDIAWEVIQQLAEEQVKKQWLN